MPLKIYFCDSCNESIPVKDLHSNRITFVDGARIFCAKCSPKGSKESFRLGAGLIAGAVGFAALVGVAYVGGREVQKSVDLSTANSRSIARVESDFRRAAAEDFTREESARLIAPLEQAAEKARKDFAAIEERLRAVEESSRGFGARQERDAVELTKRLGELRSLSASENKRVDELARLVESLRADLEASKARIAETVAKNATPSREPAPPPPAEAAPPISPEEAELARWTALLKESDPARRYEAVNGLANLHVEGAIAALESALDDPQSFVRDAAIRALRRHASLRSVPKIIASLRDPDLFVRTSAKAALKQLVGVEPAFDPEAEGSRRERGVRDFETWWGANAEKFLNPK